MKSEDKLQRNSQVTIEISRVIHEPTLLTVISYMYVVESADYISLICLTGLMRVNLSTYLAKLEEANYIVIKKGCQGKKPHTTVRLSSQGRDAFRQY
ncbi:MAG: transcriptional regulator [candidate division Zixibacteria bacterium]|nr:transcriptional regulator [candidate division Zixibacteria bacterium]